jgi:hypothetical protein
MRFVTLKKKRKYCVVQYCKVANGRVDGGTATPGIAFVSFLAVHMV